MPEANLNKDAAALSAIKAGMYRVDEEGRVFNKAGKQVGAPGAKSKSGGFVGFTFGGRKWNIRTQRMVWVAKKGLISDPSLYVSWRDGNIKNNHPSNLLLEDRSENYKRKEPEARKENVLKRHFKFTNSQVEELRYAFDKKPFSIKKMAAKLGVSHTVLFDILDGTSYRHVGGPIRKKKPRVPAYQLFISYHLRYKTPLTFKQVCEALELSGTALRDRVKMYDHNLYEEHKAAVIKKLSGQPDMLKKYFLI